MKIRAERRRTRADRIIGVCERGEGLGWIIAAGVVLFFALLLAGRVSVYFDHNGELALKAKYMCFTVFRIPKKPKKPRRSRKKRAKRDKNTEIVKADDKAGGEKASDGGDKTEGGKRGKKDGKADGKKKAFDLKSLTFDDIIDLVKTAFSSVGKPLKKLLKSIKFSHMSIGIVCGGSDAAVTAIKFGAINAAAGNVLGLLDSFFTLKPLDDMNITVDFQSEKTLYDIYFEVRLTLFAALVGGVKILMAFLKLVKAYKRKQEKNMRLEAKEK